LVNELPPEFQMFEAYLDFLEDGKLAPFARLAVKYADVSELFIRVVENLDGGRSYPFAITRLPEKMRQRMDCARPRATHTPSITPCLTLSAACNRVLPLL